VVDALLEVLERGAVPPQAIAAGATLSLASSIPLMIAVAEDLIRMAAAGEPASLRFPERVERLRAIAGRVDVRGLFDYLGELYGSMPGPSGSLRSDIQFEGLLSDAASICRTRRKAAGGA